MSDMRIQYSWRLLYSERRKWNEDIHKNTKKKKKRRDKMKGGFFDVRSLTKPWKFLDELT